MKTFLRSFKDDLKSLVANSNISIESLDGERLPNEYSWLNYTLLRRKCHKKHLEMKKEAYQLQSQNQSQEHDWFQR